MVNASPAAWPTLSRQDAPIQEPGVQCHHNELVEIRQVAHSGRTNHLTVRDESFVLQNLVTI